jgi:mRNA-degrading endonuclease RelE of RelBE toxin-antitoxin system
VPDPFTILVTEAAETDLSRLPANARSLIVDGLEIHLSHLPTHRTRRIKQMRPNPVAGWELRLGDYRVLYDVDEKQRVVKVQVIGEKAGNRLIVRGQEYTTHESDRSQRGESQP